MDKTLGYGPKDASSTPAILTNIELKVLRFSFFVKRI